MSTALKPRMVWVLNGPNLNLLGRRETTWYGVTTLPQVEQQLIDLAAQLGCSVRCLQTNHEGQMLDWIHQAAGESVSGFVLNAGAWTHTSIALRDALLASGIPTVEVHVSNVHRREEFRRQSVIADVCIGIVTGFGVDSYLLGLRGLLAHLSR